jgi:hypothetical protein
MDGRTDVWMDGRTDTGGRMVAWMDGWMDGWTDRWLDGWMDGRTDGLMDGWMNGRTDGWMDGWRDVYELAYNSIFFREMKNRIFHFFKMKITLAMNG